MAYEDNINSGFRPWQNTLRQCDRSENPNDPSVAHAKDHYFERREVGVRHPENQSIVKVTDDGYVDLFAGASLGIRIDPLTNSVNIFGDQINLFGKTVNIKTKPNELVWNNYSFNSALYYESTIERNQTLSGSKDYLGANGWQTDSWSVRPMLQHQGKTTYTDGMIQILKDLGLPVE